MVFGTLHRSVECRFVRPGAGWCGVLDGGVRVLIGGGITGASRVAVLAFGFPLGLQNSSADVAELCKAVARRGGRGEIKKRVRPGDLGCVVTGFP